MDFFSLIIPFPHQQFNFLDSLVNEFFDNFIHSFNDEMGQKLTNFQANSSTKETPKLASKCDSNHCSEGVPKDFLCTTSSNDVFYFLGKISNQWVQPRCSNIRDNPFWGTCSSRIG
mmetsp:Transcript_8284/g.14819  ORF Transcript_8284/g.14819 Transcript_8284/m.14819 type:complete len:116 (-) Transcript_8284:344-691(-)